AAIADDVDALRATTLFRDGTRITGVEVTGPTGTERIGCKTLILACNGFGGNREMVSRLMPNIESALWFGHDGNTGDAVLWGEALGAECLHLGAYQGHGNVATPHGILISWAVITEGGVQVNSQGRRFWDESQGYSEAARAVLAQPGGVAWAIFDSRIAAIARQFQDFKDAEAAGALRTADTLNALAALSGLPAGALKKTIAALPAEGSDEFGRILTGPGLKPPYVAVKVTGALFHTQGGLNVNREARVKLADGTVYPNLFASGGAAVGVSGTKDGGYLSGNGLLSAVVLGRIAGQRAAEQTRSA
ncbi:MAG: FAD-binding protein, partial [Pseudomonadota bacterium]